jgi:sulfite exporter TauE/SafE
MSACCNATPGADGLQLAVLFSTGMAMSVGHCVGMCGPIAAAFTVRQRAEGAGGVGLAASLARYHTGRLLAYVSLGLALGGLAAAGTRLAVALQGAASVGIGIGMAIAAWLAIRGTPAWGSSLLRRFAGGVGCGIGRLLGCRSATGQIGLGFLNGLLPCGPVAVVALAAAAAAASGRPVLAGLAMLAYGLGTVPALVALGAGASRIRPAWRIRLFRFGHLLLLLVAAQLLARGAAAFGWVPHRAVGELMLW